MEGFLEFFLNTSFNVAWRGFLSSGTRVDISVVSLYSVEMIFLKICFVISHLSIEERQHKRVSKQAPADRIRGFV